MDDEEGHLKLKVKRQNLSEIKNIKISELLQQTKEQEE